MSEFTRYLEEVFIEFGRISSRKMFGGYGIYHDGLMFGLVADDELYLKVDAEAKPIFEEHGLEPFTYEKNGKAMPMSYHLAPETIYDDPEEARHWAVIAYEAALRAKSKSPAKKRKPKKKTKRKTKASR